jgi:hypothetical protein
MKLEDELKDLSPWLRDIRKGPKGGGFTVPPDYFDRMEDSVFQQLDALGARRRPAAAPPREPWWSRLFRPSLVLAFGALAALALALWCWRQPREAAPANLPFATTELTVEDAEAYLLENVLDLEPELLAAQLPAEETAPAPQKAQPAELEISTEDLEQLLDEMSEEELEELL